MASFNPRIWLRDWLNKPLAAEREQAKQWEQTQALRYRIARLGWDKYWNDERDYVLKAAYEKASLEARVAGLCVPPIAQCLYPKPPATAAHASAAQD